MTDTTSLLLDAIQPLLDALIPVGHYPDQPARLAGRIPADHLAYLPDTSRTRVQLAALVDAYHRVLVETGAAAPDTVDLIIDSLTPDHLVRRPGDLLMEAYQYVTGPDDLDPAIWGKIAAQYDRLRAKGAHPAPDDLPMDGSPADVRDLLSKAIKALREFGTDRAIVSNWQDDRAQRMEGARRTADWLQMCADGSARLTDGVERSVTDTLSVTLRFTAPDDAQPCVEPWEGQAGYADVQAVHAADHQRATESPMPMEEVLGRFVPEAAAVVPPMAGNWEMHQHDPGEGYQPVPDDTWVVVTGRADLPPHLAPAGTLTWGDKLTKWPITAWRRASEQEVAEQRVIQPLAVGSPHDPATAYDRQAKASPETLVRDWPEGRPFAGVEVDMVEVDFFGLGDARAFPIDLRADNGEMPTAPRDVPHMAPAHAESVRAAHAHQQARPTTDNPVEADHGHGTRVRVGSPSWLEFDAILARLSKLEKASRP